MPTSNLAPNAPRGAQDGLEASMQLVRPVIALAAAAALVALVSPSDAAPAYKSKAFSLSDPAGDGNALNDQGLFGVGASVPAAGVDGYDIVKLDYKSTGVMVKKGRTYAPRCTGFTVKLTFADAPGPQSIVRVTGTGVVNTALWWLQYDGTETTLRFSASEEALSDETIPLATPAKVQGSSITWTILEKDLKASGEKLLKFVVSGIGASVRTTTGVITAPQWDAIPEGEAFFRPC